MTLVFKVLANRVWYGIVAPCLIVFAAAGCILDDYRPPKPAPPPPPSGTLLKSQLRVGISPDYIPLAFKDPALGLVGVEVDFAERIGNGLGKKIVFVETPFPELIPSLLEDRIDMIMSGMTITKERAEQISFTDPYARISQMALVRAKDKAAFPDAQSFFRVTSKVGFVQKTSAELAARTFFPKATIVPQPTIEAGIAGLRKGEIAVFIHDAPTVWRIAGNQSEKELVGLYWPLTQESLAWAVRKDDEPLRLALNRELDALRLSGRLKQILSKWVPLRIW
jgi:polar amino acid transport system substrate-binding protein